MRIPAKALTYWQNKAKDNPALIERCSADNQAYNIVFRYLRNNDCILYALTWDEAVSAISQINQIEEMENIE